jgi:hypothetical protein
MEQEERAADPDEQTAYQRVFHELVASYDFATLAANVAANPDAAASVFGLDHDRSTLRTGLADTVDSALQLEFAALQPPAAVAAPDFAADATNGGTTITEAMRKELLSGDLTRLHLQFYEDQNLGPPWTRGCDEVQRRQRARSCRRELRRPGLPGV